MLIHTQITDLLAGAHLKLISGPQITIFLDITWWGYVAAESFPMPKPPYWTLWDAEWSDIDLDHTYLYNLP
jgi:hypothetical protein